MAHAGTAMSIIQAALILTAVGVGIFLILLGVTLAAILRRPATAGVHPLARLVWTMVPALLLAVVLGSLFLTGRIPL